MPGPSSDFRLYHSNALDVLAGLLAAELRQPVPGQPLLAPDIVLIPQVAMRRWLQATLAAEYGIAANLEFLTPGEFVQRALDANVAGAADDLGADALRWQLYAALTDAAVLREPALQPLRRYLGSDDALKPWSLAAELASVFEKYQAWRRDWLLGWEAGQAPRDPQAALWRRIAGGRAHRARRIDDYLARFGQAGDGNATLPADLPPRLFAFATLNVSPDVLRVIATQARVGVLHFYMPTPTRSYWGDLQTVGQRLRAQESDPFGAVESDNPLLQAWGAAGRDFIGVLGSYEVVHPSGEIAAYADPEQRRDDRPDRDSLLQRLQRDLLHRRPPPSTPWRDAVDVHDPSLQVHASPTRLREVQVLHDQLRGLLEDTRYDPPLQPREIAVLAPDIDPYAPHIEAVFGGLAGSADFIPYALADTSPLASEPLAEVFLHLLALPISRFGLNEILDLLACAPIASAAGLDAPALERLHGWLSAAGARWGIDADHRQRHQAPRDDAYTWTFALDRLLLGHASGDEDDIAGIAPWPELEGSALAALDALIRLLRVLARHERVLGEAMAPAQWRERLLGLLEAILPQAPQALADQRALERLRNGIDDFAQAAHRAGFDKPVPPEVVRAHFATQLAEADTRAPLLTGGVSFGRMVPMRLLPFRAICVLGMNDGDYPRRDPAAGLNQLTAELGTDKRRYGDRSLREDDRYLLLQLFTAASEVFYLSYLGADPRDGSAREPSVLVSELIDIAARYHSQPQVAVEALVVRHPLQPFAAAAFGAGDEDGDERAEPRRYSYRSEWRPAAAAPASRSALARWVVDPLPSGEAVESLSLSDLSNFLRDPADAFLRHRLALRLPEAGEAAEDCEPLAAPGRGLRRWRLQQALFEACVRGSVDDAQLHRELRARALLPSGPLGERQLKALRSQVQPYADAFVNWRGEQEAQPEAFELDLDGVRLHGRIEQSYANGLARFRFDKLHGPSQIAHGLDWLAMSALGRASTLFQFYETGSGPGPVPRAPVQVEAARDALRALLRLRTQGLREPLPFGPRAGWLLYDGESRLAAGEKPRANSKTPWERAHDQWQAERGFSEGGTGSARLALRGRDPFQDSELEEEFRAIARIVFDAVILGRDGEAA
ncbi:exodeoxyribonuclease V subunit gamma [Pseudoxanthomonas sacheonensis]|uniref:RecBCD enzyme subunit RecC n=1 Tax=Pseudoxanthomonas sacheonensis TaxID=443615 RepID=A0ABU1RSK5_9GAMM|nr:exodeoxyribonuclease V subunit gamma [Pseudoxanthomonas sacheonensis]MDR6841748.1 exodeoxyribonuclease V gamma subunit [Pseudoxanthomonas sacheonensis]